MLSTPTPIGSAEKQANPSAPWVPCQHGRVILNLGPVGGQLHLPCLRAQCMHVLLGENRPLAAYNVSVGLLHLQNTSVLPTSLVLLHTDVHSHQHPTHTCAPSPTRCANQHGPWCCHACTAWQGRPTQLGGHQATDALCCNNKTTGLFALKPTAPYQSSLSIHIYWLVQHPIPSRCCC